VSTRLLYHAFGVRDYDLVKTEYRGGAVYLHLVKRNHCCPGCRSSAVGLDQARSYTLRCVPIGRKPVFLVLRLYTLICMNCGSRLQEARGVGEPRKSYTRAFARLVVGLARVMTLLDLARFLQVGWDLVKEIVRTNLEARARRRSWRRVHRIAIDEIALHKGQKYMTIVVDLDSGDVLYTAEGNGHACLEPFFQRLKRSGARLQAIAVDMGGAYLKAIDLWGPPGVAIVHDRYHVVAEMNDAIDKVRREEQNRLADEGKKFIKGSRYLLLYGQERLADLPEKKLRLEILLAANDLLHKAYLLKEDLRLFWAQESKMDAEKFILGWCDDARSVGNRHLSRIAATIESHIQAITAWYDHPITSGPLEGLNNKIKVLKRTAYGYRDAAFFGLRLLFIHETEFNLARS
jgi:transposase